MLLSGADPQLFRPRCVFLSPYSCDPQSHGQLPLASIPSPAIPANDFSEGLGDPLKISHVVAPLPSVRRMCVQAAGGIVPLVGTARLLQSVIPSLHFISSHIPIPSPSTRLPLGPLRLRPHRQKPLDFPIYPVQSCWLAGSVLLLTALAIHCSHLLLCKCDTRILLITRSDKHSVRLTRHLLSR